MASTARTPTAEPAPMPAFAPVLKPLSLPSPFDPETSKLGGFELPDDDDAPAGWMIVEVMVVVVRALRTVVKVVTRIDVVVLVTEFCCSCQYETISYNGYTYDSGSSLVRVGLSLIRGRGGYCVSQTFQI